MQKIISFYFFYYCYLVEFFKTRDWNWAYVHKAAIILIAQEMVLLASLIVIIEAIFGIDISISDDSALHYTNPYLVAFTIAFINELILFHNGRWKKYYLDFKKMQKRKRMIGGVFAVIIFLISVLSPIFAALIYERVH